MTLFQVDESPSLTPRPRGKFAIQTHSSLDLAAKPRDVHVLRDPTRGGLATEVGGSPVLNLPFVEQLLRIC